MHDSCRDRSSLAIGADVRAILSGFELVEMAHHGRTTVCCGSGGLVSLIEPGLCEARAQTRVAEFRATEADRLVTACASCARRLSAAAGPGTVLHYLELVFSCRVDWGGADERLFSPWQGT